MWTGKRCRQWAGSLAILLMTACATPATDTVITPDAPSAAWWYGAIFEPASTVVKGIPVSRFDPAWVRASTLDETQFDHQIRKEDLAGLGNFSFELQSDLDKDAAGEKIFVGVFETDTGSKGRFLAVTRDGTLLQHFEYRGEAGFSALMAGTDEVRWYMCMECGEFETLKWSGRSYVLE